MNKVFICLNAFFKFEWAFQKKVMIVISKESDKSAKKNRILTSVLFFLIVACMIISLTYNWMIWLVSILFVVFFTIEFTTKIIYVFTTVRGFLSSGLIASFFCSIVIYLAIDNIILNYKRSDITPYLEYIALIAVISLVWFLFSTFCNAKVATLCNAVLTVLAGIFMELSSFFVSFIGIISKYTDINGKLEDVAPFFYQEIEFIELLIDFTIFPIFVMLAIGTIGCALKQYWIDKYNGENDINRTLEIKDTVHMHSK